MNDDYLWDKTGTPDPELERLERTLGSLAREDRTLALPAPDGARAPRPRFHRPGAGAWLLAAAGLLVIAGGTLWLDVARERGIGERSTRVSGPGWNVSSLAGSPRVGSRVIAAAGRLGLGEWLVTDDESRARVEVGEIGEVTLEPNSRLRLLRAGADDHRLALERGTLHALIVAPPRHFTVETPAVRAVDLGCAYTLEVAPDGRSIVTVESGWVSFEDEHGETFIPAGARSVTAKGASPGTPCMLSASPAFCAALLDLDARVAAGDRAPSGPALGTVLAEARAEDAVTLWHLLARLDGEARGRVFDRLSVLVPPPAGVTRAGVLAADRAQLDRWWNALGLEDIEWWRLWQNDWPRARGARG